MAQPTASFASPPGLQVLADKDGAFVSSKVSPATPAGLPVPADNNGSSVSSEGSPASCPEAQVSADHAADGLSSEVSPASAAAEAQILPATDKVGHKLCSNICNTSQHNSGRRHSLRCRLHLGVIDFSHASKSKTASLVTESCKTCMSC